MKWYSIFMRLWINFIDEINHLQSDSISSELNSFVFTLFSPSLQYFFHQCVFHSSFVVLIPSPLIYIFNGTEKKLKLWYVPWICYSLYDRKSTNHRKCQNMTLNRIDFDVDALPYIDTTTTTKHEIIPNLSNSNWLYWKLAKVVIHQ